MTDPDDTKVTLRWSFREVYETVMTKRRLAALLPPDVDPDDQDAVWRWLETAPDVLADYCADYPKAWLHRDEGSLELHVIKPAQEAAAP